MKNKNFKLYIGEYRKKGLPPLTLLKECDVNNLTVEINKTLDRITYGKDLYISRPDGKLTAGWYSYFSQFNDEKITEKLHGKM